MTLQAAFAATLVDEWWRAGVRDAVVSPGSRSTPLALALAAMQPRMRVHVVLDERSAGFYAIGLALASNRPSVVLTTSGTAAAELHAAVVEAHQARVPMLVCTADRPPDLHHVGAPQTIVQSGLYGGAVRWAAEPGVVEGIPVSGWRSLASRAFAEATANVSGPGPVHLNLAFRDPLVAALDESLVPHGRDDGRPWHRAERAPGVVRRDLAAELNGRRGVIVAGRRCGRTTLGFLAEALQWPVLADARSLMRGTPNAVAAFDEVLRATSFPVETVLRIGEAPASKVLSEWLASVDGAEQIVVDPYGRWPDPERRADLVVHADPTSFCAELMDAVHPAPDGWLDGWLSAESVAQRAIDSVLAAHAEPTEPGIARALTSPALDPDVSLFVSSSMPIRDVEWYGHPSSPHRVHASRGANGIDGVVSTTLGLAAGAGPGAPVVGLLGDLAFLHDAGGLLGATERKLRCVLVVVDNGGGGIFSFLPQASALGHERFEQLFGTPQSTDLAGLAAAHGIATTRVEAMADLLPAVDAGLRAGGVHVLVVRTQREANVAVHEEMHAAVGRALA
ncbi:MAG: 2-succinyl-5-enolpyruvyl-6-hydroxy-3-cyclohexene-carboxylate synthase [Actinomycetota bacterium]|nr:2-succinyl-5-enolpyruvyl-6-hydroxy-3-cyclohexene-carboxylate synthase [Actinomycetota bacterium]